MYFYFILFYYLRHLQHLQHTELNYAWYPQQQEANYCGPDLN